MSRDDHKSRDNPVGRGGPTRCNDDDLKAATIPWAETMSLAGTMLKAATIP